MQFYEFKATWKINTFCHSQTISTTSINSELCWYINDNKLKHSTNFEKKLIFF